VGTLLKFIFKQKVPLIAFKYQEITLSDKFPYLKDNKVVLHLFSIRKSFFK